MTRPPTVADDRLDGWRLVEESTDVPFDVRLLRVVAHTAVYEDADLREAIRDRTGVDGGWRFFLASRVTLEPTPPGSAALERLVAARATAAFERRLRERGFSRVERAGERTLPLEGDRRTARLTRFAARCPVEGLDLDVEAWLAVRSATEGFVVGGGAYPRRIVAGDEALAERIEERFEPERFREELFDLIRGIE